MNVFKAISVSIQLYIQDTFNGSRMQYFLEELSGSTRMVKCDGPIDLVLGRENI